MSVYYSEGLSSTYIAFTLESYSAGVNHFISNLNDASLPLEYKLLDYKPEHWTPFKSGLLYKYMADMLNSHEKDLENTNFKWASNPSQLIWNEERTA